ncbi:MAG: OST-HTH/LOTUS domain-containing protein, partial [Verrucomicrobiaceae bacterium]
DLFINNCDEFIYYDDLVRKEAARVLRKPAAAKKTAGAKEAPAAEPKNLDPAAVLDQLREVVEALTDERGEAPVNGGMIKDALKRRDPGFNERAFGFKTFGSLLQEAEKRGLVRLEKNEKSGGFNVKLKE